MAQITSITRLVDFAQCAIHDVYTPIFITEQNLAEIDAAVSAVTLTLDHLGKQIMHHRAQMYISYCNAGRGGQSHSHGQTCRKIAKFGCVVSEICEVQSLSQRDKLTHHNILHPSRGQSNNDDSIHQSKFVRRSST